jgi:hypothetical protein
MKEMLIRQLLDEMDTAVVQRAEAVVDNTSGITDEKKGGLEDKQIRNVMAVAEETQSVAVVDNFIKYQIGRNKENEGWRFGEGQGFGEAVRADLTWLQEAAKRQASGEVKTEELAIRLVRRYLGYLNRHFKYVQVRQGGGR